VLTVGADGRFAYLVTGDQWTVGGGVVQYSIDAQTGGLTQIGSTFLYPNFFSPLVIDPSGHYAYSVVNGGATALLINAGTGTLAVTQTTVVQGGQTAVMDPTGRFLYVPLYYTWQIAGFLIDPTTGGLTPLAGSPFTLDGKTNGAIGIAIHPNGALLYLSQAGANMIAIYAIDPGTGAITPTPVAPLLVTSPAPLTFDPSGQFAYLLSADPGHPYLLGFTVNTSTGALTPMNGTLAVGANPSAVAILR
jgi:6-phosphogluconolactonase (cycloisomerase 2 family)